MALQFNANVPQAAQTIASTQGPIQTNFSSIDTAFNGTTTGAGGGTNFIKYEIQNYSAPAAPVAPVGVVHTKVGAGFLTNNPVPYWLTSVGDLPMLPDLITSGTDQGFKLGNIIINFGSVTLTGANNPVTFAIPYTTTFIAFISPASTSPLGTAGPLSFSSAVLNACTFHPASSTVLPLGCRYFAIGT